VRILVINLRHIISIGAETNDTLLIQPDFHGPHLGDSYVNTHIPLDTPDEHGLMNVFLNDGLLLVLQLHHVIDESDASAST
jgi:hypothetical protein